MSANARSKERIANFVWRFFGCLRFQKQAGPSAAPSGGFLRA
jgi:hypothetical protein